MESSFVEDIIEVDEQQEHSVSKSVKRTHEEEENNDEEWQSVTGKNKKTRQVTEKRDIERKQNAEIYISSETPMPKQFALARLFKDLNMRDIANIKYLNPYKIRVTFQDEKSIKDLFSIQELKNKGWRFSKSSEVSYSYGVIKDVDLDLSEEEIMKNITCPSSVELTSIKRLLRRNREKDQNSRWSPSETVRLCFKGNWLPAYIFVHGVKVLIEPYVYPVTQCFQCWALGHTAKTCTVKRDVCPKCSGGHANCATKIFTCINCSGRHMAMAKTCPAYLKERKIRLIMAEYNYTYSKASQTYAESPIIIPEEKRDPRAMTQIVTQTIGAEMRPSPSSLVNTNYAPSEALSDTTVILPTRQPWKKLKKPRNDWAEPSEWNDIEEDRERYENQPTQQERMSDERSPEKITFSELMSRIKEVIFLKNLEFQSKVQRVIKLCVEWIIIMVVDKVSDWPVVNLIYGFLNRNG